MGTERQSHIFSPYSGISSHSFGRSYAAAATKTPAATAMAGAKKNNQLKAAAATVTEWQ